LSTRIHVQNVYKINYIKLTEIKKIYYWSPHLVNIATPIAVINSACAIQKYSKHYKCSIINFFGEFNFFQQRPIFQKLKFINFYSKKIIKLLPKHGWLQSRFSFIIFFMLAFIPLKNLIQKDKPDYLVIHLITALPLFLLTIFNFHTKFILRISGKPRLNFLRKFFWKLSLKNIYLVTCPTISTLNYLKSLNIVDSGKIKLLYDPIVNVQKISKKSILASTNDIFKFNDYFFAAGRLTYQKNFLFLCEAFKKLVNKYPYEKLIIAGEGEDKNKILLFIKNNNLENNIILIGHIDNIQLYMKNAKCFILSSLWEDPGFVLIEAAVARLFTISSDCDTGPKELIEDNVNGILFTSNNSQSLFSKLEQSLFIKENKRNEMIFKNLKLSKKFTLFAHSRSLIKLLSQI